MPLLRPYRHLWTVRADSFISQSGCGSIDRIIKSVATIDHFPHLRDRGSVALSDHSRRGGASVSEKCLGAIVIPATEKSATAYPVPDLYFPTYRTSKATRQDHADATVRGWNCASWPSIIAPIALVSHPAFHCCHILCVEQYMHHGSHTMYSCLCMRCVFTLSVLGPSTSFVRRFLTLSYSMSH
jgi:hypothetical protein